MSGIWKMCSWILPKSSQVSDLPGGDLLGVERPGSDLLGGDFHVHSTFSDDATSTLLENLEAARTVGLSRIRMVDHVRIATTYVPEFLAAVAALPPVEGLTVLTGVEAKILTATGTLDIPADLPPGLTVLIADHQFPGPDGPWSPTRTRQEIADGLAAADAIEILISATVQAMHSVRSAQLAHLFSLLPKIGLAAEDVSDELLRSLAAAAVDTGTAIELNEKWECPGTRAVDIFSAAGVDLVASTDSHHYSDVGRYQWVAQQRVRKTP